MEPTTCTSSTLATEPESIQLTSKLTHGVG